MDGNHGAKMLTVTSLQVIESSGGDLKEDHLTGIGVSPAFDRFEMVWVECRHEIKGVFRPVLFLPDEIFAAPLF